MSRIGKLPVRLPDGVKIDLAGGAVRLTGPKGKLECAVPPGVKVEIADGKLQVQRLDDSRQARSATVWRSV
jgi:large subunit ribosomal protein L6